MHCLEQEVVRLDWVALRLKWEALRPKREVLCLKQQALSISFLPAGGGGKRPLTCLIRQDRTSARRESRRGLPAGPSDENRLSRRPPHGFFSSFKFS